MQFSIATTAAARWLLGGLCLAGALWAQPALAQRAISNSNIGGDPTLDVGVSRLVGCEVWNTAARLNGIASGGAADACARTTFGETLSQVETIAAGYNAANPGSLYDLQLLNTTADRLRLGDTVSSGGLFRTVPGGGLTGDGGLGNGQVQMEFLRGAVGNFVMAFSGFYDDGVIGLAADQWSAYYLFDNVQIAPFGIDTLGSGLMNYKLFQYRSRVNPSTGLTENFRDSTTSLVVNQVSIFQLDRVDRSTSVPEPATWALVAAGLACAAGLRRRKARPAHA
jgi:PEP-CTERM motif